MPASYVYESSITPYFDQVSKVLTGCEYSFKLVKLSTGQILLMDHLLTGPVCRQTDQQLPGCQHQNLNQNQSPCRHQHSIHHLVSVLTLCPHSCLAPRVDPNSCRSCFGLPDLLAGPAAVCFNTSLSLLANECSESENSKKIWWGLLLSWSVSWTSLPLLALPQD